MNRSLALSAVLGALILVQGQTASAGELTTSPNLSGGSTIGDRSMQKSTSAVRNLSRGMGAMRSKPMSLRSSNPYEARILDIEREQAKYEQQYQKWEVRVAKLEAKAEQQEAKARERANEKRRREIEKARREASRATRRGRGDLFSSFTSSDREETVTEEDRSRRAESFFGTGKDGVEKQQKPRLSFWQRLKRALFGS